MASIDMASIEERIRRLEDIDAIRDLKARYAEYADEKYTDDHRRKPQDELDRIGRLQAGLFTEDAVWDGGEHFGLCEGREAIYAFVRKGGWSFAMHYFLNPRIDIDGDTAKARWMLWQVCTLTEGDTPCWMSAIEDDEYRRTPEGWLMSRMTFRLKFMTRFDVPWTEVRNLPFPVQQALAKAKG
ncbi:MAG: nuclear transport factor 2 family protein [Proteobacteria bacterium]|nr:nuclear transport factor 2 family protein [Pseudomonadota bacterium]